MAELESEQEAALFGRVAVKLRFITMDQLAEATRERGRLAKKLGAVMLQKGMIDELQLGKILAAQKRQALSARAAGRQGASADASRRGAEGGAASEREEERRPQAPGATEPADTSARKSDEDVRQRAGSQSSRPADEADVRRAGSQSSRPADEADVRRAGSQSSRPADEADVRRRAGAQSSRPKAEQAGPRVDARARAVSGRAEAKPIGAKAARPDQRAPIVSRSEDPRSRPKRPVTREADDAQQGRGPSRKREAAKASGGPVAGAAARASIDADDLRLLEEVTGQSAADSTADELEAFLKAEMPTRPTSASETPPDSHTDRSPESTTERPPESIRAPQPAEPERSPRAASAASARPKSEAPAAESASVASQLEPRDAHAAKVLSPGAMRLHQLLGQAAEARASDVHLHAGMVPKMRRFGAIADLDSQPLEPQQHEQALRDILSSWQARVLDELGEVDFAHVVDGVGRFRANIYRHHRGYNGVFHFVPSAPPTLDALGLPSGLAKLTNYGQGLILITGPAGCGKTSTMAALLNIINEERCDHILTIEDPVEYIHASKRCVVNQRQVGRHTTSFGRALRGALREDPDIICIGELRDVETISLALSAAETGHLVLATLHTGSSVGTINRIVGAYPPRQQPQVRAMMSESLRAIVSQRLVVNVDGDDVLPALEVLYVTKAVGALIRDNRTHQIRSVMQTGRSQGMVQLDESLRGLMDAGRISRESALKACEDPRALGGG